MLKVIKQVLIVMQGYLYPNSYKFTDIMFKLLYLKEK